MLKQLLQKWFGISDPSCETCEVLREQLAEERRERRELLHRVLKEKEPEPLLQVEEKPQPITPQFVPWRVKQQMLEAEDRKRAQLMREKQNEIEELEKEMGIPNA